MTGTARVARRQRIPRPDWLALGLLFNLAWWGAATVCAQPEERALLWPTTAQPAQVSAGQSLAFVVHSATGLTPPPGIQEPRAHRAFSARLCARGVPVQAAEQACFGLLVRNVRPLAAHSLEYRVEAPVPHWLAPGSYDLSVRFPGGAYEQLAAVTVGTAPAPLAAVETSASGVVLRGSPTSNSFARLHLGPHVRLSARSGPARYFPLPGEDGQLTESLVAWLEVPAGTEMQLSAVPREARDNLSLPTVQAMAGTPVTLQVFGASSGAAVAWYLGPGETALGARIAARFVGKKPVSVSALVIEPDGRATKVNGQVDVNARRAVGCALSAHGDCNAGLLLLLLSWKLGPGRSRRRAGEARDGRRFGRRCARGHARAG